MGEGQRRRSFMPKVAALLLVILLSSPSGSFTVDPGPVTSLDRVVAVEGYSPPEGHFYMVSVLAKEARVFDLVVAAFRSKTAIWPAAAVYGGLSPERYVQESKAIMEGSQRTAARVALSASGFNVTDSSVRLPSVSVEAGEVVGPSAGLAFALEIVSYLEGVDLTGGKKIAATGVLRSDGSVLPVGGAAQKAAACEREGLYMLLVPHENLAEAQGGATGLAVVGVRTLQEAISYLTGDDDLVLNER